LKRKLDNSVRYFAARFAVYAIGLIMLSAGAPAAARDPFALQLRWLPQAQFMGFYIAKEKGFYEAEGLDVTILPGGPGIIPSERFQRGEADAVVEWLPTALAQRERGLDLINVGQIFQASGLTLICRKERGIVNPEDLRGKTVAVWYGGNEVPFLRWMSHLGVTTDGGAASVKMVEQGADVDQYFDKSVDCLSAMSYNEYWRLLARGAALADLSIFRYEDKGFSLLEDGLYVSERRLGDRVFRDRVVRFLRASLNGWRYAAEHIDLAVLITLQHAAHSDATHQTRMATEVKRLLRLDQSPIGLLSLAAYDRTVGLLSNTRAGQPAIHAVPKRAWTHDIWYAARGQTLQFFTIETRYRLDAVLSSPWFYALDLLGTLAFGIAGFIRARERQYDLWGAFVLTFLPAVGGGTLRDLLVGGDRHPPFIFKDPTYIYIVIGIVVIGTILARRAPFSDSIRRKFPHFLLLIDPVGIAAFTIIGAKVAIIADLYWFWIPICAAATCAGGGVLLDICTGREPRTFTGEIYEELAILGGLVLIALLSLANHVSDVEAFIVHSIIFTFSLVYGLRIFIVQKGLRAPRLIG